VRVVLGGGAGASVRLQGRAVFRGFEGVVLGL
jgi:hypothetical protein